MAVVLAARQPASTELPPRLSINQTRTRFTLLAIRFWGPHRSQPKPTGLTCVRKEDCRVGAIQAERGVADSMNLASRSRRSRIEGSGTYIMWPAS